jgi:hypothetical protein
MNFKDIIHEMLITENTDKRKAIERSIGFSPAWADEFYNLNEKYCIWIANSFLNEYIKTHKKTIEKKYNKPIKGEVDLKRAAREILNTTGPRNLIWKEDYEDKYKYIFDWLTSPRIADRVNVKILSFKDAFDKSTIWHESLETGVSSNYKEENEVIIDYRTNGLGFYWANLNTSMSEEEKRRMGHCGNDPGKVIFSLRSVDEIGDGRSHVTISYDPKKKTLGQMKGPKNRKPKEIFFKYIVDIILNKKYPILGFEKNIYAYDTNFQLSDLSDEDQKYIFLNNKDVKIDYLFSDKKKLYELAGNKDVFLFKQHVTKNITKQFYGIVNVETLEVIKDYEYVIDEKSEFTDTIFFGSSWFILKLFKSVKNGDEFIILLTDPTKLKTDNREFKIISKEEAKKMIDENPETKLNK